MRNIIIYLIVVSSLISCKNLQNKRHLNFIKRVEVIGLDKFTNIEYGSGNIEDYTYHLTNDTSINWMYNKDTKRFEFPVVPQDFGRITNDYKSYINAVRKEIRSLDVVMITQSPWIGNIIRFWLSDSELIEYVNPDFKFDNRFKIEWLKEIRSSQKLKDNWYYIKINKKTRHNK